MDCVCELKPAFFIIPGLTSFEYLWLVGSETWDEPDASSCLVLITPSSYPIIYHTEPHMSPPGVITFSRSKMQPHHGNY